MHTGSCNLLFLIWIFSPLKSLEFFMNLLALTKEINKQKPHEQQQNNKCCYMS